MFIKKALFSIFSLISLYCCYGFNENRKNIYQKDVSEYCRRRVLPSVFLSRHVMDAHAQMLHFSQLDVPYSCFLSIRAESGSNIILVIQLPAEERLGEACDVNQNQLIVYEMGETFGGYWGPIPDDVALMDRGGPSQSPSTERYYTLKTTPMPTPPVAETESEDDSEDEEKAPITTPFPTSPAPPNTDENYVQVEIPLLDVSGILVKTNSNTPVPTSFSVDDTFDMLFDVQPKPGDKYETSELPLVQFSMEEGIERRANEEPYNPEEVHLNFQMDYGAGGVTQDPRLTLPDLIALLSQKHKGTTKYKHDPNRRLIFPKNKKGTTSTKRPLEYITKLIHFTNDSISSYIFEDEGDNSSVSLHYVDELLDMLKVKDRSRTKEILQFKNTSSLLKKIADAHHNISVYMAPDLSVFNVNYSVGNKTTGKSEWINLQTTNNESSTHKTTEQLQDPHTGWKTDTTNLYTYSKQAEHITESSSKRSIFGLKQDSTFSTTDTNDVTKPTKHTDVVKGKTYHNYPTDTSPTSTVDHKSWDNVVQAVPALIGMLNDTDSERKHRLVREKRRIQSIQIKRAQPHELSTEEPTVRTSESLYLFSDIQDFAQLVELPDDELYGHVAMRYMARYVGSTLFNICEYRDHQRHLHLLNSSRIVISINQFSMKRMTLVVTPARTLLSQDARCPSDHIECQVSGARVCINSMTACDGVPNCGSLDIYDEDRLSCGALVGLQHNVYVTAFTFLAVLITLLYIGHYWIKRCVPKVSDAFFVYRNGCENVLYLNTIMRSPSVSGGGQMAISELGYPGLMYEDAILSDEDAIIRSDRKKKRSIFQKVRSLFRSEKSETDSSTSQADRFGQSKRRCYSFAEEELNKMMTRSWDRADASVQTGESLEMRRPFAGVGSKKKSKDPNFRQDKKASTSKQIFNDERQATRLPSEKVKIGNISRLPALVPANKQSLERKGSNLSQLSSMNSELNVLKFFRDARSASLSYPPNIKLSPIQQPRDVEKHDMGTAYEKEIAMVDYGIPRLSSNYSPREQAGSRVSGQADSTRKRLRFDENPNTTGDIDYDNAGPSNAEGISAPDDENPEHKTLTDFRRFWGNTFGTKSSKEKKTPRRPSHF